MCRRSLDRDLPKLFMDCGRITGGAVKASGDNGERRACLHLMVRVYAEFGVEWVLLKAFAANLSGH